MNTHGPNGSAHPAFGSDEWRDLAATRKGRPEGEHIGSPEHNDVFISALPDETPEERIARVLERMKARDNPERPPSMISKFLEPGFLLTVIVTLGSVIFTGVGLITRYQADQAAIYAAMTKMQGDSADQINKTLAAISSVQGDVKYNRDQMVANQTAAEARAARYAPMIEAEQRAQDVTNNRVENIVKAISDLRESVQDMTKIVMQDHTDTEVLKMRVESKIGGDRPQH